MKDQVIDLRRSRGKAVGKLSEAQSSFHDNILDVRTVAFERLSINRYHLTTIQYVTEQNHLQILGEKR